jgi:AAA+ ATPase superfamily predicted ATPase
LLEYLIIKNVEVMCMAKFTLTPVAGNLFIGRRKLLQELVKDLGDPKSTTGFCIYGMRRIGKTSLLKELERRLSPEKRIIVVYFSMWDLSSLSTRTFVEELSRAVIAAYQEKGLLKLEMAVRRVAEGARAFIARIVDGSEVKVRVEDVEFLLTLRERKIENYSSIIRQALNLGEELAEKTSTKCVLMIDEFPDILKVENGLQVVKMLRTAHESQRHVGLVISGSVRKTMEQVALSEASPFYRQLVLKKLQPLTLEEVQEFLKTYAGIEDKKLAGKLLEITGGVPFYLQYLGRTSGLAEAEKAVEEFLREEGSVIFQEEYRRLNETEKLIVTVMAKGRDRLSEIAKLAELPATTVSTYLRILMDKEVVYRKGKGKYGLVDRMFSRWLERRFA